VQLSVRQCRYVAGVLGALIFRDELVHKDRARSIAKVMQAAMGRRGE
jgi:hypothetical protein